MTTETPSPAFDFGGVPHIGAAATLEIDGFTVTATIAFDPDFGEPWKEHEGHGAVTDWTRRDKRPGERILNRDGGSRRFYDFAGAVRLARSDGWGVTPYRVDRENGANGLHRLTGQWFHGRELVTHRTDWHDDIDSARGELYALHRESMSARAYAALAAEHDFAVLKAWCDDEWQWCGVVLDVKREGVRLGCASLWGIESATYPGSDGAYLVSTANELLGEALDDARATLARLNAAAT